ncbi:MAG: glycosyltransferase [Burkholderiales bacterium]|nr:glycosyltransferase [Burkholderiales bacterium]
MATITTLIPAYKKDYLGETFLGLQRQTHRDFRVIVSDDSPGDEISALIHSGHFGAVLKGLDVQVLRGPKNARLNHRALVDHWQGRSPYVHLLMDDDLIYPGFYSAHLAAHATGRYSASVSRRWYSHLDTRPVHGVDLPDFVARSPLQVVPVEADAMFTSMVPHCHNWMGEFSNMLISAEGMAHWPKPPADGLNYFGWVDVGFLLSAVQHAPIAVLRDHLGVFRQHPEQTTHKMHPHGGIVSNLAWVTYALQAWKEQRISHAQAVAAISFMVMHCLKLFGEDGPVVNRFYDLVQTQGGNLERLYQAYTPFWLDLLRRHPSTLPDGAQLSTPAQSPAAPAAPAHATAAITYV